MNVFSKIKQRLTLLALSSHLGKSGKCGTLNQTSRDIWLEKALSGIPAGSRILDAGAGELQYKKFCPHLRYVSQDFAKYDGVGDGAALQMGSWDQSKIDIVSDIIDIPEPDASFDAVLCVEVLEHVPKPVDALRELARLLKPGGTLILTAPFCALTHFSPYFYHSGFSRYFYEYWADSLGLNIVDMEWNGNYFEYLAQEIRRLPEASKTYALSQLEWVEKKAVDVLLGALNRFSEENKGSEQLLAFGLHIIAQKRGV
jgi:SAM-dependent methyltransferase